MTVANPFQEKLTTMKTDCNMFGVLVVLLSVFVSMASGQAVR
jgi:hypothetical protein